MAAEIQMLREQLRDTEADRRKWQTACSTLMGRLLAINDTIAGAVRQAAKDGLHAMEPADEETTDESKEPGEADAVAAAATQCAGAEEGTPTAARAIPSPARSQAVLGAIPLNPGQGQIYRR
jgi:hypothetical protein